MNFSIGDLLSIQGEPFRVVGKITYKNSAGGEYWDEYRVINEVSQIEKWLSIDDTYKEYSISVPADRDLEELGYHEVDRGRQVVLAYAGEVDVDKGESASFIEYEDDSEEFTYSIETWMDGTELSMGYYLDPEEITFLEHNEKEARKFTREHERKIHQIICCSLVGFIIFFSIASSAFAALFPKKISKYLKGSTLYTYETSITGEKNMKADVYSCFSDKDTVAKNIIDYLEGDVEDVLENTEDDDDSIAIMTKNEYCLIYTSVDEKTLIQISSRKYTYACDEQPYHSTHATHRYYRRYYYSRGYNTDSSRYSRYNSSYSGYSDSSISSYVSDGYSSYSSSVRQYSTSSRYSSGGGTSYGK